LLPREYTLQFNSIQWYRDHPPNLSKVCLPQQQSAQLQTKPYKILTEAYNNTKFNHRDLLHAKSRLKNQPSPAQGYEDHSINFSLKLSPNLITKTVYKNLQLMILAVEKVPWIKADPHNLLLSCNR